MKVKRVKAESMKNRWFKKILRTCLFLLLLIGLIGITAWSSGTGSTLLCQKCHVMKPQAVTLSVSSHRNLSCASCHINPRFVDRLNFSLSLIPKGFKTLTKRYTLPLHTGKSVSNTACLQCHTPNRTVTPFNDLIVPHDLHYKNGVYCVFCHQGVGHGRIDERYRTMDKDFDKWTPEYAEKEMALGNVRIGMTECMECHLSRKSAPLQCVGCHEKMITPDSHKSTSWKKEHGQQAVRNLESCEECHNYINIEGKPLEEDEKNVAEYARNNNFCLDCHRKTSSPHADGWLIWHSRSITYENADQCLVCHELNLPSYYIKTTRTHCSTCHGKNLGPAFH